MEIADQLDERGQDEDMEEEDDTEIVLAQEVDITDLSDQA
jgi:hypothetical protein